MVMLPSPELLQSDLVQRLQRIRDYRSRRGKQYPQWVMLLLSILGAMSGAEGYAALEDFGIRHYQTLCEALSLGFRRAPSDTTLRRMFHRVSFEQLTLEFNAWSLEQFAPEPGEWLAIDGKSVKGTFYGDCEAFQNFVGVVSLYSQQQRLVLAQQGYENKKSSEIHVVWDLLDQLELKDVIITFDALHAQKNG